jgi:hypothetical protein
MTAYATGTATSHTDLFAKLKTFLTTNATLVAAGQQWTTAWTDTDSTDVVLKGPDNIYVGLRLTADSGAGTYALWLNGMTGLLSSATSITEHLNPSTPVAMYLDNQPMAYWFVASGRRFSVVVKISTVFEACYAGFFLPYAPPTTYPYPMFIGASRGALQTGTQNWRSTDDGHTHFVSPYVSFYGNAINNDTPSWMLDPTGQWVRCWNNGGDPGNPKIFLGPEQFGDGLGSARTTDGNGVWGYDSIRQRMGPSFDGSFALMPITLTQQSPADQTYGILDGVYRVPGNANSSENIITASGVDHLVVQNCFRTGVGQYWALALA